jgi:hypothetical protein
MGELKTPRPPVSGSAPDVPARPPAAHAPATQPSSEMSGRVGHDERGNAVWNWIKDTGKMAIDATSRLLKKLEVPELKVEDTHDTELRILDDDRCPGGGYDPYNQSKKAPKR